jgi:hypothetical protein
VRGNATVIERILKQAGELQGLGDTEGKKIPFSDVVAKYNKGITEPEIKAWVWYKRRMGVPMSGCRFQFIPTVTCTTVRCNWKKTKMILKNILDKVFGICTSKPLTKQSLNY